VTRLRLRLLPNIDSLPGTLLWLVCAAYLAGIVWWWTLRVIFADTWWWLFLLNSAAVFLFVPLPFAAIVAVVQRNILLLAGALFAVALFISVWGGLLWPHSRPEPEGPVLTVMTYNLLVFNQNTEGVLDAIRQSDADVVGLVELNSTIARAIGRELAEEYPYQVLSGQGEALSGAGVISRYPLQRLDAPALDDPYWVGGPIAVEINWDGGPFVFVAAHSPAGSHKVEKREHQAKLIRDFAAAQTLPLIVAGDFNASPLNQSVAIVKQELNDAFGNAGTGFGHTFPGASDAATRGSSRPQTFGIPWPQWLVRIDYVFYSDDWQAIDARIAPWEGNSDHRGVVADLALPSP
jgi:endonuclease/exonuclease/phosphatase (EEP) superfamily protein YafD